MNGSRTSRGTTAAALRIACPIWWSWSMRLASWSGRHDGQRGAGRASASDIAPHQDWTAWAGCRCSSHLCDSAAGRRDRGWPAQGAAAGDDRVLRARCRAVEDPARRSGGRGPPRASRSGGVATRRAQVQLQVPYLDLEEAAAMIAGVGVTWREVEASDEAIVEAVGIESSVLAVLHVDRDAYRVFVGAGRFTCPSRSSNFSATWLTRPGGPVVTASWCCGAAWKAANR